MEAPAARFDHLAVNSLFHLVTHHLDCPMAVLTQHTAQSQHTEVLAVSHMDDRLASGIAHSIQKAVILDRWQRDSASQLCAHFDIETEYLPEGACNGQRFTFICQVEPTFFLALSACRLDPDQLSIRTLGTQEIHDWVDAHMRLLWQLKHDRGRAEMLAQALDLFDFGTFLLDQDGNLVFGNQRAWQLLDLGDGLRRAGQSVTATDFDNAVRLQTTIQHLSHYDDSCSSAVDGASLMLVRRTNARPLVAVLARLTDSKPGDGAAVTALYVLDPDKDIRTLAMALCRAYGLTSAEAGLVIRLVGGLTIEAAARDMHIQPQTARAYLKQIFPKTDTHRQADLVRVILGAVVPIRSAIMPPSNGGNHSPHLRAEHTPVWG